MLKPFRKTILSGQTSRTRWYIIEPAKNGRRYDLLSMCRFLKGNLKPRSVILFGSMARGNFRDSSDVDLFLVTREDMNPQEVRKMIPKALLPKRRKLNLSIYSEARFLSAYKKGSLFFAHLLDEGKVLYDDGFYRRFRQKRFKPSTQKMRLSLKILKQKLEVANDLKKFNNLYVGVLSDFFLVSKEAIYNLLALDGHAIFDKEKAFSELAAKYPRYEEEIRKLHSLEPFFLRNVKGIKEPLPFSPYGCEERVIEMRNCVKSLLYGVGENVQ